MQPIINRQKELKAYFYAQGEHKQKSVTYTDDAVLVNKKIVSEYHGTGAMVWVDKELEKQQQIVAAKLECHLQVQMKTTRK